MKHDERDYLANIEIGDGINAGIRRMLLRDLSQVTALERIQFDDPWSLAHFRHEIMTNKLSWPLVVEVETQIIGYAVTWFVENEIHIANLAIDSAFRRRGLALELIALIFAEGMERGATCAFLEVRDSNEAAIELYKKCGFEKLGIRRGYYRDGEDALVMRRFIPALGTHLRRLGRGRRNGNVLV